MDDIEIITLTDAQAEPTVGAWRRTTMTITQQPTDIDVRARLRASMVWLERNAPEQLECTCPEACVLDHDN
jgi:hypothetical protein